jgi:putative tryptophan/tyrosine transport system substrate-binding protein
LIRYVVALSLVLTVSGYSVPARSAEPEKRIVRIGFVDPQPLAKEGNAPAFWSRLRELGWVEGRNLIVEARSAEGHYDRLPALMAELVDHKVDLLVTYSTAAGLGARKATTVIPIVDAAMGDPVRNGLVASLSHPGGNLTGVSFGWTEGFAGKSLELLQDTVPRLNTVAMITNPDNPFEQLQVKELASAAETLRLKLRIIPLRNAQSLQSVLEQVRRAQALLVLGDPLLYTLRREIVSYANQHRLPALYGMRGFVEVGGMMAYGPSTTVTWRRAAEYVDKILRRANPGDLPIEQPTRYPLTINAQTVKAVGITLPESVLLRADEVLR